MTDCLQQHAEGKRREEEERRRQQEVCAGVCVCMYVCMYVYVDVCACMFWSVCQICYIYMVIVFRLCILDLYVALGIDF